MINQLTNSQYAQSVASFDYTSKVKTSSRGASKSDSVLFSDEAYAALEAYRNQKIQPNTSISQVNSIFGQISETPGISDASVIEEEETLLEELKEYIKNPTLKHAMDKMEQAVEFMDFDDWTSKTILDLVKSAFRSGIPAEGDQTTDVLNNLKKNIKDDTGLTDAHLTKFMEKISVIVADAQKNAPYSQADGSVKSEAKIKKISLQEN